MKFLIGLCSGDSLASWNRACVEMPRQQYERLQRYRAFWSGVAGFLSLDLSDDITVFDSGTVENEGEAAYLDSPEEFPVRLPDDWVLPELVGDEAECRIGVCVLVLEARAIHWEVYPKHGEGFFETDHIPWDYLEQEFERDHAG